MKNKLFIALSVIVVALFVPAAIAEDEIYSGIGADLFQDPFNKKVIITRVFPNSPAQRAGLIAGDEIVSVDNKKVRKLSCICEVSGMIRGNKGTAVNLVIKKSWWKREKVEIVRDTITLPTPKINPELEKYWAQVAPGCYLCSRSFPEEIAAKFSRKYRKTVLPVINYWASRKAKFELGYNTCVNYSKNNKEICLINLLNRENAETNSDKQAYKLLRGELK